MMEEANQEVFALSGEEAFSLREYQVETRSGRALIQYIVCEPLEEAGFLNAFSTRVGGVSPLPENSLNLTHFKAMPLKMSKKIGGVFWKRLAAKGCL